MLIARSEELLAQTDRPVLVPDDPDANSLVTDIVDRPHAFVYACIADRQVKADLAWRLPFALERRLGSIEPGAVAALSRQEVVDSMRNPDALHRFPDDIGEAIWLAAQRIRDDYDADASRIWASEPPSAEIVARFLAFHGVGPKIATMAANILATGFHVPVSDRYSIDVSVDVQVRRVMQRTGLVDVGASTEEFIYRARALSPEYPAAIDRACWDVGRTTCRPGAPDCGLCVVGTVCPRVGVEDPS